MRTRILLLALFLLALLLAACQTATDVTPSPTSEEAAAPTATTAAPTEPPPTEPPPTATAVPPTATPAAEGQLDYTAAYGGAPAFAWDKENLAAYQAMHPDLEVKHIGANLYGNPVPTGFYIFLDSDRQPDVFSSFVAGVLRSYIARGAIADISDLWQEMGWDEVYPQSVQEMVTIDGKQYFVPMAVQWNPIWYRADIFAEVGLTPPQTWDDLLAACETLNEAGYLPIVAANSGWTAPLARWFTILNLRLNGPEFHQALMAGEESYEDPRVRAVFEHWAEMFSHNCFTQEPTSYGDAAQQLFDGEAAMYNLGEWLSESYDEGIPDTFDFFSFPVLDPELPRGEIAHVYGAYMVSDADHPQEAREFLKHLGSVESHTSNVETLGRVSANLEVDPSQYSDVYQRGLQFVQEADYLTPLFEFSTDPIVAGEGLRAFEQFWQNPEDIDAAIALLERARKNAYGVQN